VLDGLKIDKAHIVGLSMGSFATFCFGMKWPERALSLTLAGVGSGSMPGQGPREIPARLFHQVELGQCRMRDPRATPDATR
jgi:pimeloyl-ACP methyl ester carboxylesterase